MAPPCAVSTWSRATNTDLAAMRDKLEELKRSLLEIDVFLDIQLNDKIP